MKKIVNNVMRVTEEMMRNLSRQFSFENMYVYVHERSNLIERIRVVDDCSICSGRNRLLLDRLRDVLGEGLFCMQERRVYASLRRLSLDGIGKEVEE